jgi:glycine/D-amino acid oxidase-like deaminating enzyme
LVYDDRERIFIAASGYIQPSSITYTLAGESWEQLMNSSERDAEAGAMGASATPIWSDASGLAPPYPRLDQSTRCDVVVVGGGVCGAFLACELSRAKLHVVLVDRAQPAQAATAASTGLLQYELDTPLTRLAQRHGRECATAVYRRWSEALHEIRKFIRRLDDDCSLATRPSVFLAGPQMSLADQRAECIARNEAGIPCDAIDAGTLYERFGLIADGAIVSEGALEVDPVRLTRSLLRLAQRRGVRIYGKTDIAAIDVDSHGVTLTTQHGRVIRAGHALYATGSETPYFIDHDLVTTRTTFALASDPIDPRRAWSERCLIWESGDPYFYARLTPDDRVLIGGEDVNRAGCQSADDLALASMKLLSKLRLRVPQLREVKAARVWCGAIADTEDGLPIVDRAPESARIGVAMGHGGNGITFGWIAARILTGMVLGEPDPAAAHFRMSRFYAKEAPCHAETKAATPISRSERLSTSKKATKSAV